MNTQAANQSAQNNTGAGLGSDFRFNLQHHAETDPNGTPPAGDPPAASTPPAGTTPPAATPPADGTTPPGTTPPAAADPNADPAAPVGAPDKYEFTVPEGYNLNPEASEKVSAIFKKHNLSNEAANEMAAAHVEMMQTYQQAQQDNWLQQRDQWVAQVQKDPELGGANQEKALAAAQRGLQAFGSPGLNKLLVDYGIGDNPDIIRAFYKAGLTVKEDSLMDGKGSGSSKANVDSLFFPNTQK